MRISQCVADESGERTNRAAHGPSAFSFSTEMDAALMPATRVDFIASIETHDVQSVNGMIPPDVRGLIDVMTTGHEGDCSTQPAFT